MKRKIVGGKYWALIVLYALGLAVGIALLIAEQSQVEAFCCLIMIVFTAVQSLLFHRSKTWNRVRRGISGTLTAVKCIAAFALELIGEAYIYKSAFWNFFYAEEPVGRILLVLVPCFLLLTGLLLVLESAFLHGIGVTEEGNGVGRHAVRKH